jgi:outer membrane protein assembly factor BamB
MTTNGKRHYDRPLLSFWIAGILALVTVSARADDWPQWLGPHRDGIWRETGLLERFPSGQLPVLWRTPLGTGYSGPAVADDRVYVMDRQRAKDAAGKPVRPARTGIAGNERVVCLSADSGKIIWEHAYDCPYKISYGSGPRTTPLVFGDRVYTLGAMGDLCCLNATDGKVVWSKNVCKTYNADLPLWGYAAHPLIDGDLLFTLAGGEGSAVVALNKDTGKEVWKALTTQEICYSPPMLIEAGGCRQLIIWHSESINGLDPATGKLYWSQPYPTKGKPYRPGVNIATVRRLDDMLFITSTYHGPMMLKLAADKPSVSVLWQLPNLSPEKPVSLNSLMPSPLLKDGHIYGIAFDGELRCLEAKTGKKLWSTFDHLGGKKLDCGTAFLIPQGERTVIFNDQGDLILAELTPMGYRQVDRTHLIDPLPSQRGRDVVWSHPAFAKRCVFVRNDREMVCVSLAAPS